MGVNFMPPRVLDSFVVLEASEFVDLIILTILTLAGILCFVYFIYWITSCLRHRRNDEELTETQLYPQTEGEYQERFNNGDLQRGML